jgi:hypothetical protein
MGESEKNKRNKRKIVEKTKETKRICANVRRVQVNTGSGEA